MDEYLAALPEDQRVAMQRLREQVRALVPDAVETISYGMPTLRLDGQAVFHFAAWKEHCRVYGATREFLDAHADELKGYGRTDKGSIHFTPERPLPAAVVEDLVRGLVARASRRRPPTRSAASRSRPRRTTPP